MMKLSGTGGRGARIAAAALTMAGAFAMLGGPAWAQAKQPAAQAKKPASAWVKLCEKAKVPKPGKDGKPTSEVIDICLTHHERLDGNTGLVIISAAIREVKGRNEPSLMIMVPLGMALPPGVKAAVYSKEQWARAQKKKRVDDKELKPVALKYSLCHASGCTAEIKAPANLVDSMKTGGGLMVLALNAAGRPVVFPVPLTGFAEAHAGKPVDGQKYAAARQRLMGQIQERILRKRLAARERFADRATDGKLPDPKQVTSSKQVAPKKN